MRQSSSTVSSPPASTSSSLAPRPFSTMNSGYPPTLPVVVENDSQADWVDRPTGSICEPHSEDQSPRVGHAVEQVRTERRAFRAPSFSGFLRPVGVVVCAFQLIGGDGAAEEETRRETIKDGWIPLRSRALDRDSVGARFVGTRV